LPHYEGTKRKRKGGGGSPLDKEKWPGRRLKKNKSTMGRYFQKKKGGEGEKSGKNRR